MVKHKRYTVTLELDIYARNDQEAKYEAAKLAQRLSERDATVEKLIERPVGVCNPRTVHKGHIYIWERKIHAV